MMADRGREAMSGVHVAILGAGAWGTTLALLAHEAGQQVTLMAHRDALANSMATHRKHPTSLPGITIPLEIEITSDVQGSLTGAEVVVVALPTQSLRKGIEPLTASLQGKSLISVAKGLEIGTLLRPTQILQSLLGESVPVAALAGPNLAAEIAQGRPASAVVASEALEQAATLGRVFHSRRFRVYHGDDVIGVELGGALKNIIAIGAGIADGLGAGDNAKAAFMTRGIAEIARVGEAMGARPLTFAGLSGIGDLIATCASPLSRNHQVGVAIAKGRSLEEIQASMQEVAEGIPTTRAARELGRRHRIEMPMVDQMHRVLFEGLPVGEAIERLLEREPTVERVNRHLDR
jgi:glycerol-3-phosphate dehydrogenase (NAD(P)+)